MSKVSITELILLDWKLTKQFNFSHFLLASKIKKITISLVELVHINQFIVSLSKNRSVVSATIYPDQEYTGYNLNPIRDEKNEILEHFQLNMKLPLWFVDILNNNLGRKMTKISKVYPI